MIRLNSILFSALAILAGAVCYGQSPEDEEYGLECTSILVGRLASADGSVITSHTCDGVSHTWVAAEPAKKHKKGEVHRVYRGTRHTAFREDTTGVRYMGEIPEAEHTYAYLNTGYPCLNEKQLGMGETTFTGPDTLISDKGIFLIEELARIALQRCDNAREACRLMGTLAEQYGYADGGECLTVADPREAWQFEIMGPGKGRVGAIWAAKRVPDGEVAVSCNIARIGRLERENKEGFMCSDNVEQVCKDHGLWDGKGEFIFWKAAGGGYGNGKNFREREFVIFSTLAPSLGFTYDMAELPFSIKPDEKVDVRKVMELQRGTYEGTEFDMTKNILMPVKAKDGKTDSLRVSPVANPWVTTNWQKTINQIAPGAIEFHRTLAVAWCSYSTVIQLRGWLPDNVGGICWYAVDNPAQSPHIPIFSGTTKLPKAFEYNGQKGYKADCVLWQFRRANKLATLLWQDNKKEFTETLLKTEDIAFDALPALDAAPSTSAINKFTADYYKKAAAVWDELEAKYWVKSGRGF